MSKYVKYVIFFGCLLLFGFIAVNVYLENDFYSDGAIYDFISSSIMNDNMTTFMKIVTWFGGTLGIIIMCICSMCIIRNKKINISLVICLIAGTLINSVLKNIFVRIRPNINPLVEETGYSFPSGHSMMSMVFYGYLIYLICKYIDNKKLKYVFVSLLLILIVSIGFTRIYLGVHYASDVVGGFVFGIFYLILYIEISKKIMKKI